MLAADSLKRYGGSFDSMKLEFRRRRYSYRMFLCALASRAESTGGALPESSEESSPEKRIKASRSSSAGDAATNRNRRSDAGHYFAGDDSTSSPLLAAKRSCPLFWLPVVTGLAFDSPHDPGFEI